MTHSLKVTADHMRFYHDLKPIRPLIQEGINPLYNWSHAVIIPINTPIEEIERVIAAGKWIVWQFDFELENFFQFMDDEAVFSSFTAVIDQFIQTLWANFKEHTFGVSLCSAAIHFSAPLPTFKLQDFADWLVENATAPSSDKKIAESLFSAEIFSQYIHRIVSFLPDEILPFLLLDVSATPSQALIAQLVSKHRFQHVNLGVKGSRIPLGGCGWEGNGLGGWIGKSSPPSILTLPQIGVCLPSDPFWNEAVLEKIDRLLLDLEQSGIAYRVLSEEKLTEEWDGIDEIIVFSSTLTARGKRKLLGFSASGGSVLDKEGIA